MDGHALIMDFILISGININILILYLLIKSRDRGLSQYLLIACFSIFIFYIIAFYSDLHDIKWLEKGSFLFTESAPYLLGPLLYFYIKSLFVKIQFNKRTLVHFIPFLLHFSFITLPFFISLIQRKWLFSYLKSVNDYGISMSFFEDVYLVIYLLLSLRLFSRFQIALKSTYSSLEEKDLNWSKRMLLSALIVLGVDMSSSFYDILMGESDWISWSLTIVAMVIFEIYLGYYGTRQSRVFIPSFLLVEAPVPLILEHKDKFSSSHLANASAIEINELAQQLKTVLANERPYLNDSLTLNNLAKMLPTTDKKLSALLNLHLNISFYDLINQHRVHAVKEKLSNPEFEHYSLLGIALDSGFKSKTSFNRVFKKETGLSPSAYKNQKSR